MAAFDQNDWAARLINKVPKSWFLRPTAFIVNATRATNGLAGSILYGIASAFAYAWNGLLAYAKLQTRISSMTDSNLDGTSSDFFGPLLPRAPQEQDPPFSLRIREQVVAPLSTRPGIQDQINAYLDVAHPLGQVDVFDAQDQGPPGSTPFSEAVLALNPRIYLRLNDASPGRAVDSSPNGNDGIYNDAVLDQIPWDHDVGSASAVAADNHNNPVVETFVNPNPTAFTAFLAFNYSVTWPGFTLISAGADIDHGLTVFTTFSDLKMGFTFGFGSGSISGEGPAAVNVTNVWYPVFLTFDGSNVSLYAYISGALTLIATASTGGQPLAGDGDFPQLRSGPNLALLTDYALWDECLTIVQMNELIAIGLTALSRAGAYGIDYGTVAIEEYAPSSASPPFVPSAALVDFPYDGTPSYRVFGVGNHGVGCAPIVRLFRSESVPANVLDPNIVALGELTVADGVEPDYRFVYGSTQGT